MKKIITSLLLALFIMSCENGSTQNVVNYNYDIDARSEFFTVRQQNWSYDPVTRAWFYTLDTPIIDNFTIDFGAVLVYVADLETNDNRWRALPRTEVYYITDETQGELGDFNYSLEWGYWFGEGYLELELYYSQPDIFVPDFDADFKLVVLTDIQAETLRKNNINTQNYAEVKNALDL